MKTNISSYKRDKLSKLQLRNSSQFIIPSKLNSSFPMQGDYNIYPVSSLGEDKIFNGYNSLAKWVIQQKTVIIDGYVGVFWDRIQSALQEYFVNESLTVNWINTEDFFKSDLAVKELVQPFLGTEDSVWGTKTSLNLKDFFELKTLTNQFQNNAYDLNIVIGPGAALVNWTVPLIYIDLPKNELQFRMRAGSITNLGSGRFEDSVKMYKRFYFVDWVVLNEYKKTIFEKITVIADGQWLDNINWMFKTALVEGLNKISHSVIRVRPWFEPGIWGGQWIKQNIENLNKDVVNYAWSFELIVPENGLVFESNNYLVEISFDFLMFHNKDQILGKHAQKFGDEFPIRFDFLDTWQGDNLSIQCHPKLKYIKEVFGESITQDETYYILDCQENAKVYLGFQETINPETYRSALEKSQVEGKAIVIEDYVQAHTAKKHDLFLIPNSTVHSAGAGNLVLEISATPYIFTFKMYDWVRLDLDGNPRPINIEHAFNNLDFSRKGNRVQQELISKPVVIAERDDFQLIHVPTHAEHYYDVHRIEFDQEVTVETNNSCHVMMLVEGQQILIKTLDGTKQEFAFAETFVVPAAAKSYVLKNLGKGRAKVIKAFLK